MIKVRLGLDHQGEDKIQTYHGQRSLAAKRKNKLQTATGFTISANH